MSSITYDKDGKTVLHRDKGTRPHPLGSRSRDPEGRPVSGLHKGQFEPGSPDAPDAPQGDADRINQVREAIAQLDARDQSLWTDSGAPKVEALANVLGWKPSADERTAAWEQTISEEPES